MDEEITHKSEPPQPPDFDPPDGRGCPYNDCACDGGSKPHPTPGTHDRERAITLLMAGYEKTGMQSLFDERACAYTVDAWICAMRAAMEMDRRQRFNEARDRVLEEHADTFDRLRRYESGEAERAIRTALGATDGETTLAAARRVVAARDVAREANRTVGDDAYRRGIVIGLSQAFDIVTDSSGDTLGRLEAMQRIRDARDRARKRHHE